MNKLLKSSINITLLILLISSCGSEEVIEGPCENLQGRIHQDLRDIFPYSNNLKGIVFENTQGEEFLFNVIEKRDAIEVVNANSVYPYEAERVEFELLNSDLNLYFTITLYGGYATFMCPEEATPSGFVSIKGPLNAEVPSSSSTQSYNLILVQIIDGEIEIQSSDFSTFLWLDNSYKDVYEGQGDFEIFFNFDIGIVGFNDPNSSMKYVFKKILTE